MIDHILVQTENQRGKLYGERVTSLMKKMTDAKMPTGVFPTGTFGELLYGPDLAVGNFLQAQINNYSNWDTNHQDSNYKYDLGMMRFEPLEYPPEMFVHLYAPSLSQENLDPTFWSRLADLRNRSLQQYADLYLEEFILDHSIRKTVEELGLDIPSKEREEAYRLLVPGYASIRDQVKILSVEYPAEIRRIMIGLGYPVERDLW